MIEPKIVKTIKAFHKWLETAKIDDWCEYQPKLTHQHCDLSIEVTNAVESQVVLPFQRRVQRDEPMQRLLLRVDPFSWNICWAGEWRAPTARERDHDQNHPRRTRHA